MNLSRKTFIKSLLYVVGFTAIFSVALATNNLPNGKFEIVKIQNPLDVLDIQEIVNDVKNWKEQISNKNSNGTEPLSSAMVQEVTTTLRQSFGKLGIEFKGDKGKPLGDAELLMAYQASIEWPLNADNYKKKITKIAEAVEKVLLNDADVEAARYIFASLKNGVIDDNEKPKLEEYKKKFINLEYSAPNRASMLGQLADNPDGKDVLAEHAKVSKQGDVISERVVVYLNDEKSKANGLFNDMLARVGVVGEMPKK